MSQADLDSIFIGKIYAKLVECAVNSETLTTEQLLDSVGFPKSSPVTMSKILSRLLSHVSGFEQLHERPMLTALIVQKNSKPTKAWLKTYIERYYPTKLVYEVEEEAKRLLTARAAEECKELLNSEQQKVFKYWRIP